MAFKPPLMNAEERQLHWGAWQSELREEQEDSAPLKTGEEAWQRSSDQFSLA